MRERVCFVFVLTMSQRGRERRGERVSGLSFFFVFRCEKSSDNFVSFFPKPLRELSLYASVVAFPSRERGREPRVCSFELALAEHSRRGVSTEGNRAQKIDD